MRTDEKTQVCEGCGRPMPDTPPTSQRPTYRLTATEVGRIRALIRRDKTDTEIAEVMNVTPVTVWSIRRRKTWSS